MDWILTDFGIPFKMGTDNDPSQDTNSPTLQGNWDSSKPKSHYSHHGQMARLNTLCETLVKFSKPPMWRIGTGEQLYWLSQSLHSHATHNYRPITGTPSLQWKEIQYETTRRRNRGSIDTRSWSPTYGPLMQTNSQAESRHKGKEK